jgi:hypothetical protein
MFTVILVSDQSRHLLKNWMDLFAPFEERGDLAFCRWNSSVPGDSLDRAAPTLAEVIRGKSEWRAIVVGIGDAPGREAGEVSENPYDFAWAQFGAGITQSPETPPYQRSPFPLVRLTHMLLGFPELGPKGFTSDPSYFDPERDQRVFKSEFLQDHAHLKQDEAEEAFQSALLLGHRAQTHYHVDQYSPDERRKHESLTEHYTARQSVPQEVILVSPRLPSPPSAEETLRDWWQPSNANLMSRFTERNNYPASCRFTVFDMKPLGHAGFDLEEMKFALGLLTLSINELPASSVQADRLYRLGVDLDEARLGSALNAHLGDLVAVRQYIDMQLRTHRPAVRSANSEVLPSISVSVNLDQIKGDDLQVPSSRYGLSSDRPSNDSERWRRDVAELEREAARFMREPPRALQDAVLYAQEQAANLEADDDLMSDIDLRELEEALAESTRGLVRRASGEIIDSAKLARLIETNSQRVSTAMNERMRWNSVLIALGAVLGSWAAALLPYLVGSMFNGGVNFAESLLIFLIVLGIVLGVGILTLEVMRRQLLRLIRSFNDELRAFAGNVIKGAQLYGEFLSDLVTHADGRRRLAAARRSAAHRRKDRTRLQRLRARIEERIENEKSIIRSLDEPVRIDHDTRLFASLEEHGISYATRVLLWEPGQGRCGFNHSGESIRSAYGFVTTLTLEDLVLTEPVAPPMAPSHPVRDST